MSGKISLKTLATGPMCAVLDVTADGAADLALNLNSSKSNWTRCSEQKRKRGGENPAPFAFGSSGY